MGNLNYIVGIAKILEVPSSIQLISNDLSLYFIRFRVQFSSIKNNDSYQIVNLIVWGDLAYEIISYYKVNDYILIEGHVFFDLIDSENYYDKLIQIKIIKIIPFFL